MHIVEHHDDLAGHYHDALGVVGAPDAAHVADGGELLAIARWPARGHLVVVYREVSSTDGFVITAFYTTRIRQIERRRLIWQKAQP